MDITVETSRIDEVDNVVNRQHWRTQAACRPAYGELNEYLINLYDNPRDLAYPPEEVAQTCASCIVRPECLEAGMKATGGIWGGLTQHQREQLNRKLIRRRRCPGCSSTDVVNDRRSTEVCLACGLSWARRSR